MPALVFRCLAWMKFVSECCRGQGPRPSPDGFPTEGTGMQVGAGGFDLGVFFSAVGAMFCLPEPPDGSEPPPPGSISPGLPHVRAALIQRYSVILGGGRGVVFCFCGMHP